MNPYRTVRRLTFGEFAIAIFTCILVLGAGAVRAASRRIATSNTISFRTAFSPRTTWTRIS